MSIDIWSAICRKMDWFQIVTGGGYFLEDYGKENSKENSRNFRNILVQSNFLLDKSTSRRPYLKTVSGIYDGSVSKAATQRYS